MVTWKSIWNEKKEDITVDKLNSMSNIDAFTILKRLDGFDVNVEDTEKYYGYFYHRFESINTRINEILNGSDINSVFEVGCGSGVNLYMYKKRNADITVGGVDYSKNYVKFATDLTGSDDIHLGEAIDMSSATKYDIVFSDSVFQYFGSLDYAETVLSKMINKANYIVFLGEIHDEDKKEALIEYRRSTIRDYDKKYKDLSKLFISKDWIKNISKENGCEVFFENAESEFYLNSKYVYDCYIVK